MIVRPRKNTTYTSTALPVGVVIQEISHEPPVSPAPVADVLESLML